MNYLNEHQSYPLGNHSPNFLIHDRIVILNLLDEYPLGRSLIKPFRPNGQNTYVNIWRNSKPI